MRKISKAQFFENGNSWIAVIIYIIYEMFEMLMNAEMHNHRAIMSYQTVPELCQVGLYVYAKVNII